VGKEKTDTMENVAFSPSEVRNKILTDRNFAAGFVIDNNYSAIKDKLAQYGVNVNSEMEAYNALLSLGNTNPTTLMAVLNVPYNDQATNYTAGYSDFFVQKSPAPSTTGTRTTNWAGILTIAGGIIAAAGAAISGQNAVSSAPTAEEIAAAEAEAKAKKRRMWWGIGIGAAVIIMIIVIIWKTKKKK